MRGATRATTRAPAHDERKLQTKAGEVRLKGAEASGADLRDGDHRALPTARELGWGEGTSIGEMCRKRKKYIGPSELERLRQLEEENGKLKKIVVPLSGIGRHCSVSIR
jgi:hypothetical protein